MDKGRMGDVMPLELAMKRELSYRKKVENLLWQLYDGESTEDPFTSQAPSPNPSSGQNVLGTEPKTLRGSSQQPHPPQNYSHRVDELFCRVCQVTCPSTFHLRQHLIGHKCRDTLDCITGRNIGEDEVSTRQWCEICKIWCMNKYSLRQHFMGKKHQDKVQELRLGGKEGQEKTVQVKRYCELCELWCMDEYAFSQHLNGKKHILNLHAFEQKRTAKGKGLAAD